MLRWCQNVSVYNIENHYHFYNDHEPRSRALSSAASEKLRAGIISVNSTINSKRNSQSCSKKGLKLSKMLKNPEQEFGKFKGLEQFKKQFSRMALNQDAKSVTDSLHDITKTKSMESETLSKQFTVIYNKAENNQSNHQISSKPKLSVPILDFKQQNNLLLTNLYSTQSSKNKRYSKKNKNPELLGVFPSSHQPATHSRIHHINEQMKSQFELSESFHGQNSRYNTNRSASAVNGHLEHSNDRVYYRILEMSRGEARQASIILSNILSRSAHTSYCQAKARKTLKNNQKRINLQDKLTILSQNDAQSESSLKVQQSELYESDPKNNFTLLNKTLNSPTYTICLAIQNSLNCIVSLKQIGFRQMSSISQQLQMYEFLQQNISKSDIYRNILELYQVQMTNGSYLLIKEPFTDCLLDYIKMHQKNSKKKFVFDFQQTIKNLLIQLYSHQVYPTRMLTLNDFVLCEEVVKIHDMSIFKQMKSPSFQIDKLIKELMSFSQIGQGIQSIN